MSYLLSPLKKAEQSRGGQPGVPLSPVAVPPGRGPETTAGAGRRWWWLFPIALAVAALMLVVLDDRAGDAGPGAAVTPGAAAPEVTRGEVSGQSPAPTPATAPPPRMAVPAPPRVTALPPLAITGYIYFDDNPAASKVFVDGMVHRRGSSPGPGMVIQDFRPDRVIIAYRGALHEVPVR